MRKLVRRVAAGRPGGPAGARGFREVGGARGTLVVRTGAPGGGAFGIRAGRREPRAPATGTARLTLPKIGGRGR
ncbi:hypothetical protein GCM10009730_06700 [Streptomyces albidochromogenes]